MENLILLSIDESKMSLSFSQGIAYMKINLGRFITYSATALILGSTLGFMARLSQRSTLPTLTNPSRHNVASKDKRPLQTSSRNPQDENILAGLNPLQIKLLQNLAQRSSTNMRRPAFCFAPETPENTLMAFKQLGAPPPVQSRFRLTSRWSTTATNGSGLAQGDPTTLTWGFLPDGTNIPGGNLGAGEASSNSNLIAFLNGIYTDQATWQPIFQTVFDRWTELTGNTYIFEANDDGAAFPNSPGDLGVRPDIRIGGHLIDGNRGILAYNFFPNTGDMVIDSGDNFYSDTANSSLKLRNVVSHEHGHGLGIRHVCPVDQTKLMEPFISIQFDGPQHDDTRAGQRHYGDRDESNNSTGTATSLGALADGSTQRLALSLDSDTDVDFYTFTLQATGKEASIMLRPMGFTYLEGPQNGDGSCSDGTSLNTLSLKDLGVELLDSNGTTILASATGNPAGQNEWISNTFLPSGTGPYFLRIFGDAANTIQLYDFELSIADSSTGDQPEASNDAETTNEDTSVNTNVLSNDNNLSNTPITVTLQMAPINGTAVVEANGTITYTPEADFNGTDNYIYKITDNDGDASSATVNLTINSINDSPSAQDDSDTTDEDTPVTTEVLLNDSNLGDEPVDVTITTQSTNGSLLVLPHNTIRYTPEDEFNGSDSYTYTVTDNDGETTSATVTLTVVSVDDFPVALQDTATTNEDTPLTITVLSNDSGLGDAPITVAILSQGGKGNATVNPDNSILFTPNENINGTDQVTYQISDQDGDTSMAVVDITINAINDPPTVQNESATINEDTTLSVNVLTNDSDVENDSFSVTSFSQGKNGSVSQSSNGQFTYTPNLHFNGQDSFSYTVTDTPGGSTTGQVTVQVTAVEDVPDAVDDSFQVTQGQGQTLAVLSNDQEFDGDPLRIVSVTQPGSGTATIAADGSLKFQTNSDASGSDAFTYTIDDGKGNADTATIFLTIATSPFQGDTRIDQDGDGFPDELENGVGTSPTDSQSTPFDGAPAGTPQALDITKAILKLNFAKTQTDALAIMGTLPIPEGFDPEGQQIIFDMGGIVRTFTLNAKGKSPAGQNESFRLRIKKSNGLVAAQNAKFKLKAVRGSFVDLVSDEGFDDAVALKLASRTISVIVTINNEFFTTNLSLLYTVKPGKKGKGKF